jgi:hypothetical protein
MIVLEIWEVRIGYSVPIPLQESEAIQPLILGRRQHHASVV